MPPLNEGDIMFMPIADPSISLAQNTEYAKRQDAVYRGAPGLTRTADLLVRSRSGWQRARSDIEMGLKLGRDVAQLYAFARPRIFDYVFSQPRGDARRFPDDFRARKSPTLTPVADVVAAAMKDGTLKQDDVWEVTLELWAHVHGYLCLYRAGRFHLSKQQFRKLVHRSMRRLFDGLKA
jgi:hypothetical protein